MHPRTIDIGARISNGRTMGTKVIIGIIKLPNGIIGTTELEKGGTGKLQPGRAAIGKPNRPKASAKPPPSRPQIRNPANGKPKGTKFRESSKDPDPLPMPQLGIIAHGKPSQAING